MTLHPAFVAGPPLTTDCGSSLEVLYKFIERKIPGIPHLNMPVIDVRDLAQAHFLSMVKPVPNGSRLIIAQGNCPMPELIGYIDKELRPHGYNVQNGRVSYCPLYLASFFDSQVAFLLPFIGYDITTDW